MISLVQLLKEAQGAPKAIILAGAPGAGKSSVVGEIISDLGLKVMNIDDFFIKNLRDAGISLDLKMADAEGRSGAAKAMQAAQKEYQQVLAQEIGAGKNIVIDGTYSSTLEYRINKIDLFIFTKRDVLLSLYRFIKRLCTAKKIKCGERLTLKTLTLILNYKKVETDIFKTLIPTSKLVIYKGI